MIWQFLKTCKEQNNILKVSIKDFFVVTNVLHVHMKQNAVMGTKFDLKFLEMEELCTKTAATVEKAQKVADKAHQLAQKIDVKGKNWLT